MAGEQLAAMLAQAPGLHLQAGLGAYQMANQHKALALQQREQIIGNILQGLGMAANIDQGQQRIDLQGRQVAEQEASGKAGRDLAQSAEKRAKEAHDLALKIQGFDLQKQKAMMEAMPPEWQAEVQKSLLELEQQRATAETTRAQSEAKLAESQVKWDEMTTDQRLAALEAQTEATRASTEATRFGTERGRLMLPGDLEMQGLGAEATRADIESTRFNTKRGNLLLPGEITGQRQGIDQREEAHQAAMSESDRRLKMADIAIAEAGMDATFRDRLSQAKTPEERQGLLLEDPDFARAYTLAESEFRQRVAIAQAQAGMTGQPPSPGQAQEMAAEVYNGMLEDALQSMGALKARYDANSDVASWKSADRVAYEELARQIAALRAIDPQVANINDPIYNSGLFGGNSIIQQLLQQSLQTVQTPENKPKPTRPQNR